MNFPAILFGWLLASSCGLIFHLIRGGPLRRLTLYMIVAWLGFAVGQQFGSMTGTTLLRLGAINLLTAILGSIIALVSFELLAPQSETSERPGRPDISDQIKPH